MTTTRPPCASCSASRPRRRSADRPSQRTLPSSGFSAQPFPIRIRPSAVVACVSSITTPTRRRHRSSPWLCAIPSSSSATSRCTPSRANPAGPRRCAWPTRCRSSLGCYQRTPARSCATRPFRCCFASPTVTPSPDRRSSAPPTATEMPWYGMSHAERSPVSMCAAVRRAPAPSKAQAHTIPTPPRPRPVPDRRRWDVSCRPSGIPDVPSPSRIRAHSSAGLDARTGSPL
jgi:hypothetical protein